MKTTKKFNYYNKEIKQKGGKKTVRLVSIRKGKGYKSISHYHNGKHQKTHKNRICPEHLEKIKKGKFVPGLFKDCLSISKKKV